MSSPITEIATLNPNDVLKADPDLLTQFPGGSAKGLVRRSWGSRTKNPNVWQVFLDWETLGHHERVQAHPDFADVKKLLATLVTPPTRLFHVPFMPYDGYTKALAAPVTEVIFTKLKDTTDTQAFAEITEVSLVAAGEAEGCISWAWGYVLEDKRAAVIIIGWESVEAHENFLLTEVFRATTAPFIEAASESEVFYVKFAQR